LTKCCLLAEIALIFAVFFIQGAYPVPEVNEPYYLGKAIHFWNPDWARGDFFLDSADTHQVFYLAFGWLSLWLPPPVLAWVGRVLTWGLLAWAWQRLSWALVPRRWFAPLTAALLAGLSEWCHMAGEWIVGGVEAKGFAFVLVLLALEALVRNRWNRAWLLLGAASAFHVLVGGWSAVAAGLAWLLLRGAPRRGTVPFRGPCEAWSGEHRDSPREDRDSPQVAPRPPLRSMWPAMAVGALLSLPGLLPALLLNGGTEPEVVRQANSIYVYQRLYHHLDPTQFPTVFILRFAVLCVVWLLLCHVAPATDGARRLRAFVTGAVSIATVGVAIGLAEPLAPDMAAGFLRLYWFRLADVAVPLGVALLSAAFIADQLGGSTIGRGSTLAGRVWLVVAAALGGLTLGYEQAQRPSPMPPRADRLPCYVAWWRTCHWVAESPEVPPDARFITPRMAQTFKWYARRAEVANWKDVPQDAASIVEWWRRMEDIYAIDAPGWTGLWHDWPGELGAARLRELGARYRADYALTLGFPRLPLPVVHEDGPYVIYRLSEDKGGD
jgi:hypothetical protein